MYEKATRVHTCQVSPPCLPRAIHVMPRALRHQPYRGLEKAHRIINELKQTNPEGQCFFIKVDVSTIKNVDVACHEVQQREKSINILLVTAGYMSLEGRRGKSA